MVSLKVSPITVWKKNKPCKMRKPGKLRLKKKFGPKTNPVTNYLSKLDLHVNVNDDFFIVGHHVSPHVGHHNVALFVRAQRC